MSWRRRKEPILELLDECLFVLGSFDLSEPFEIGVGYQFRRQRTIYSQKKHRGLFEPVFPLSRHQAWPPFLTGEVFSSQ